MATLSIANSMVPSQRRTVQSFPNPNEFGAGDWGFNVTRAQQLDWSPLSVNTSSNNFFTNLEPSKNLKNRMFNPLTGQEPVFGHVNCYLNPLEQEQTNAKMAGYQLQKITRVADNMSPVGVMRFPTYQYPVGAWQNVFEGSRAPPVQPRPFSQMPRLI